MSIFGLPLILFKIEGEVDEELSSVNYPIYMADGLFGGLTPNQIIYNSVKVEDGELVEYTSFFNQIQDETETLKELFIEANNIQSASGKTTKVILILRARSVNPTVIIRSSNTANMADGTIIKTINKTVWSDSTFLTVDNMELLSNGFLTLTVTGNVDVESGVIIRQA